MDIDKVQQINAMAGELRKHNFASSSEDAAQQAEQVLQEKQENKEKQPIPQSNNALAEKKMELLLEMNYKKHNQELALLRSALNTLAQEFETIKSEVKELSEQKPKEKQTPLKTEPKEKHPRQGDYKSEDVDMQKMFYCGNKSQ